jgi:putative tryptophan/tyrosine transport system substrate-binding protein
VKRRQFITLLGGAAAGWPLAARAQQRDQPARVGILTLGGAPANPLFAAFRQEMHGLGYVEGRNLVLEFRSAADDPKRLPELAAELVRLSVKVMLVEGTAAARAAKEATSSIPIVMGVVAEPMEAGLVSNLARPGGNITGFTSLTPELGTKRLGLLKEAFPDITRVGVLRNPRNPGNAQQLASIKETAARIGVDVETAEAERREAIGTALDQLRERGASALIVLADSVYFNEHKLIVLLVTAKRLPAIYPDRVYVDAGGMIIYGPDVTDNFRRAAHYVDRILKGTKPGDLPIQQPTKFALIINATLAKAIGVTLPTTLLLRADEVIE